MKPLSVQDFLKGVRERKFSPVYLFYGEEDYLLDEALEALIAAALPVESRDFNLDALSASEVDMVEIIARANSFPMMADRRVVIVRDFERRPDRAKNKEKGKDAERGKEKDALHLYLENPSQTTILVLISEKSSDMISDKGVAVGFDRLKEYDLPVWIIPCGKKYGKEIARDACEALVTYVGSSLRALEREIEKISIYVGGKNAITIDDVNAVVGVSKTYNVFELSNAVGNRDLKRSLEILKRMIEYGEHPTLMVAVLTKQYMRLLKLAEKGQRKGPYTRAELERSFAPLTRADEKLKFTSEDPRSVMTVLLYELMH